MVVSSPQCGEVKIQPFFQFSPWRDPRLRLFAGYPFGVSRNKASTIFFKHSLKESFVGFFGFCSFPFLPLTSEAYWIFEKQRPHCVLASASAFSIRYRRPETLMPSGCRHKHSACGRQRGCATVLALSIGTRLDLINAPPRLYKWQQVLPILPLPFLQLRSVGQ